MNKTVFRIGFKLHCYIQELDRYKKSKNFYELLLVVTSLNSSKHGIFFLSVLLKVFLFLKVCDRDQVELEAMVLDYPKFYNHGYCSLAVIFHSSPM